MNKATFPTPPQEVLSGFIFSLVLSLPQTCWPPSDLLAFSLTLSFFPLTPYQKVSAKRRETLSATCVMLSSNLLHGYWKPAPLIEEKSEGRHNHPRLHPPLLPVALPGLQISLRQKKREVPQTSLWGRASGRNKKTSYMWVKTRGRSLSEVGREDKPVALGCLPPSCGWLHFPPGFLSSGLPELAQ